MWYLFVHISHFYSHKITFWRHEITTRKVLTLRNNSKKLFCTHEIPTGKEFGLTKYQKEKTLDPQNTHKKNFCTHKSTMARWNNINEVHNGTRPTEFTIVHKKIYLWTAGRAALIEQKSGEKQKKELKRFNFLKLKPALSFKNNTTDT